jgi:2-methylisocitrate lyase-like PEP mutase family enzyme
MTMSQGPGHRLRQVLELAAVQQQLIPFVGIYDLFSASLAADHFGALFLSGFGLAAKSFGLPDVGFICWGDFTTITSRLRALLPDHHLLVEIDDGCGDAAVAIQVARTLEPCGASSVVLEDQARPRRCGHLDGKNLLPQQDYLVKLEAVLHHRSSMVVVARTEASDPAEILTRVRALEQVGCDAVHADGIKDLTLVAELRQAVSCPMFCNINSGGKVPGCSRAELARQGAQGLNDSIPYRFAVQSATERALDGRTDESAELQDALSSGRQLSHCNAILEANLRREGGA